MSTLVYNYNSGNNQNVTIANISGRVTVCEANITALNQTISSSLAPITANSSVSNAVVGDYIVWDIGSTRRLTSYTLNACSSLYGYGPNTLFWTILGSTNNSTWSVIDTQTNPGSNTSFTTGSTVAYRYFAISYQRVNVSTAGGLVAMIPSLFQDGTNFGQNITGTIFSSGGSLSCASPKLSTDPQVFFNNPFYGYTSGVAYTGGSRIDINGSALLYPATTALSSINSLKSNVNTLTNNINNVSSSLVSGLTATNAQVLTLTTNSQLPTQTYLYGNYLTWDLGVGQEKVLTSYAIYGNNGTTVKMSWSIIGSNDRTSWALIDSKEYSVAQLTAPDSWPTSSTTAYRYFGMVIRLFTPTDTNVGDMTPVFYNNNVEFGNGKAGSRTYAPAVQNQASYYSSLGGNPLRVAATVSSMSSGYPYPNSGNPPTSYTLSTPVVITTSYPLYPVTTINSRLNVVEANITALNTTVANISGGLVTANNNISVANANIANISGGLVTANANISTLNVTINATNGRLTVVEANITALQNQTTLTLASLNVTGASTLAGVSAGNITGASLNVTGNVTVGGNLNVSGNYLTIGNGPQLFGTSLPITAGSVDGGVPYNMTGTIILTNNMTGAGIWVATGSALRAL